MDEHNVVVNITAELEKSITDSRPYSSTCCIYRVPPQLRSANEKAYTPILVSIGPLHHENENLRMMEETKKRFLKNFTRRPNVNLSECVKIVKEKDERLRECYQETFPSEDNKFLKTILVDAIFIVELFLTIYSHNLDPPVERERQLDAEWVLNAIDRDLLLIENQLPFFIIKKVWKCATKRSIYEVFYHHFNYGMEEFHSNDLGIIINYKPKHFVDLVTKLYTPLQGRHLGKPEIFHAPSVTELRQAGVKFKVIKSSKNLFDVSFSEGILKIPKWRITDSTEVIFRNLIAFEQCYGEIDKYYICHYVRLMDYLVNTSRDVDLLVKKKILENWLGDSSDVSSMINKLGFGVGICRDYFYFADIFDHLNNHCEKRRNKWMANLKQNYFNTPWAIISFCGAILLLILTFVQTVCSIISTENQ